MPGKEAETADTFDEDAYRDELIDKEGYSDESARMKAKKKKEQLANQATKIEIDLGSLAKDDKDDEEHLSPEERKKRQKDRDKRQKERAAYRIIRQKQHDDVEEGIPEGKMESVGMFFKSKKRVWVKPTATKKGYYREQEVGRKEKPSKEPWQIPIGKFVMSYVQSKSDEIGRIVSDVEVRRVRLNYQQEGATIHAKAIKEAVASGKKIPKTVLKDYPQYK